MFYKKMGMKKLVIIIILSAAFNAFAQDWPLKSLVIKNHSNQTAFSPITAFTFIADKPLLNRGTYQELRLNASFSKQLLDQKPAAIQIKIPLGKTKSITCELVKFSLGNVIFTENNNGVIENVKIPLTYRGVVLGDANKNMVTLTVNDEYISLVASLSDKVIQVTKADEESSNTYRLYNSDKVQFPIQNFECGNKEKLTSQSANGILLNGTRESPIALQDKCINVFVDCFDSLFINQSSNTQKTINYVYELFNSVATGFYNDTVNVQITTINVWTTMDPYRGDTRENALYDLGNYWKDNFWGNICVGLDFGAKGRSGIAGGIGRVKAVSTNTCPAFQYGGTDSLSASCYNDLNYSVNVLNFPTGPNTTQQQVYLVMHEMGHLLGAHHTKWCGWKLSSNPDVYGTIDSCGKIEGTCMQGPPPTSNGATIMSYCLSNSTNGNYVNYLNGFGKLPGNAIRNFIEQSACLLYCSDCFGWLYKTNNDYHAYNFKETSAGIKYIESAAEKTNKSPGKLPDNNESIFISQKTKR